MIVGKQRAHILYHHKKLGNVPASTGDKRLTNRLRIVGRNPEAIGWAVELPAWGELFLEAAEEPRTKEASD